MGKVMGDLNPLSHPLATTLQLMKGFHTPLYDTTHHTHTPQPVSMDPGSSLSEVLLLLDSNNTDPIIEFCFHGNQKLFQLSVKQLQSMQLAKIKGAVMQNGTDSIVTRSKEAISLWVPFSRSNDPQQNEARASLFCSQTPPTTSNNTSNPGKVTAVFEDITISSNFDSGNLAKIEECKNVDRHDTREFNLWTSPDCADTEFENGNKTWFYFSVCIPQNYFGKILRFNILNLNRQTRLYQQGLTPITKTVPGRGGWERLRSKTEYENDESGFKISFETTISESRSVTIYFAFCYPYSYSECQRRLARLDNQLKMMDVGTNQESFERIYYYRELLCHSLEGRRIDLITVTSWEGALEEREPRLPHLFPDTTSERCHSFRNKKVIFVSSRVHPGETPSSYVFNGLLQFLLRSNDPRATKIRRKFVFKLIPMLNPDGVFRGHYRTDTCGANLNRYYLNPDPLLHPSIYAARSLILYHHHKYATDSFDLSRDKSTISSSETCDVNSNTIPCNQISHSNATITSSVSALHMPVSNRSILSSKSSNITEESLNTEESKESLKSLKSLNTDDSLETMNSETSVSEVQYDALTASQQSGIALYMDLHAHATKRGVFMYGNYFSGILEQAENMLLPKLISLNSPHLDFEHCVFSEKNMYTMEKRDGFGLSKEGSGRVAIHKATGIIPCYTLECNYNSGRQCNTLTEATMDDGRASPHSVYSPMAHRYSISDFEQVGCSIATSVLDLYQLNPWSRLPTTTYGSVAGLRQSLVQRLQNLRAKRKKISNPEMSTAASVEKIDCSDGKTVTASSLSSCTHPIPNKHFVRTSRVKNTGVPRPTDIRSKRYATYQANSHTQSNVVLPNPKNNDFVQERKALATKLLSSDTIPSRLNVNSQLDYPNTMTTQESETELSTRLTDNSTPESVLSKFEPMPCDRKSTTTRSPNRKKSREIFVTGQYNSSLSNYEKGSLLHVSEFGNCGNGKRLTTKKIRSLETSLPPGKLQRPYHRVSMKTYKPETAVITPFKTTDHSSHKILLPSVKTYKPETAVITSTFTTTDHSSHKIMLPSPTQTQLHTSMKTLVSKPHPSRKTT